MIDVIQKPTLLKPHEHSVRIDASLHEARYLEEPTYTDEYIFSFMPLTGCDFTIVDEAAEKALMAIAFANHYTRDEMEQCYEDKYGLLYCSQLFAPKLNTKLANYYGAEASLSLHFRDSSDHKLYLQADYIDFYDPTNGTGIEPETPPEDGDWDF